MEKKNCLKWCLPIVLGITVIAAMFFASLKPRIKADAATPNSVSIIVKSTWIDEDNKDNIRPDKIQVNILRNGSVVDTVTLNDSNDWYYTIDDQPKYDSSGNEYEYTAKQVNTPAGYKATVTGTIGSSFCQFHVKNTHEPVSYSPISVNAIWSDVDDVNGIRPDSISVTLLRNDSIFKTVTLNVNDGWRYDFGDLPDADPVTRQTYTYSVKEPNVPSGYTASINGFTITNSHIPYAHVSDSVSVNVICEDDEDADGVWPEELPVNILQDRESFKTVTLNNGNKWTQEVELSNGYNYIIDEINIPGYETVIETVIGPKPMSSASDHNHAWKEHKETFRTWIPNIVTVDDYETQYVVVGTKYICDCDFETTDKNTISEHLKNHMRVGDIQYTGFTSQSIYGEQQVWVGSHEEDQGHYESDTLVNYYTCDCGQVTPAVITGFTITNSHAPAARKSITINAVWDDENDIDRIRPDSVSVNVLQNNSKINTVILNQNNNWTYTLNNLPETNPNTGQAYTYSIERTAALEGYTISINGFTITCSHTSVKRTDIRMNAAWNDEDNADDIRPADVSVNLLRNGSKIETVVLNGDNGWSHTFTDMPESDPKTGLAYRYTIESADNPAGYIFSVNDFTATYTHAVKRISITAGAVWNDDDDKDGIRPDSISADILRDDNKIRTVVLSKDNDWSCVLEDLPRCEPSTEQDYVYSMIMTDSLAGYSSSVNGFTVTNTHEPVSRTSFAIKVLWNDMENADGLRPEDISITVLRNEESIATIVLNTTTSGYGYLRTCRNQMQGQNGRILIP